jgi:hypothetical protein
VLLAICDICSNSVWGKAQCSRCIAWAERHLDHSGPDLEPIRHLLVPSALANEIGGQWKVRRGPAEFPSPTLVYHLQWVRNGRALYALTGELEGLGAARV